MPKYVVKVNETDLVYMQSAYIVEANSPEQARLDYLDGDRVYYDEISREHMMTKSKKSNY